MLDDIEQELPIGYVFDYATIWPAAVTEPSRDHCPSVPEPDPTGITEYPRTSSSSRMPINR